MLDGASLKQTDPQDLSNHELGRERERERDREEEVGRERVRGRVRGRVEGEREKRKFPSEVRWTSGSLGS